MTAIIAILNKSAVAVSADSAVTIGTEDSRKVYNYANKIFNLSIGNPVGIMIYNSAEFCGVPWETIIKMYRRYSGNGMFGKLVEYRDDFLVFLKTFALKYFDGTEEDVSIGDISRSIINDLSTQFINEVERTFDADQLVQDVKNLTDEEREDLYYNIGSKIIDKRLEILRTVGYVPTFEGADIVRVKMRHGKLISNFAVQFLTEYKLQEYADLIDKIVDVVSHTVAKDLILEPATGLIFTGFGEDEIFPSLHAITVGCVINGKIRYSVHENYSISQHDEAAVFPFAQTDIIQTFIEGIGPRLKANLQFYLRAALDEIQDHILFSIDGSTEMERGLMKTLGPKIEEVTSLVLGRLETARRKLHIEPMMNAVATLSKEDLAAMADSLINTTYLHRRASFAEETVGGPVDVAIITKGDGFVWIKRKHYFDSTLNLNYLTRGSNHKFEQLCNLNNKSV